MIFVNIIIITTTIVLIAEANEKLNNYLKKTESQTMSMGTLLDLTHDELKEVYLSLTKGQWKNLQANKSAQEKTTKVFD